MSLHLSGNLQGSERGGVQLDRVVEAFEMAYVFFELRRGRAGILSDGDMDQDDLECNVADALRCFVEVVNIFI